MKSKKVFVFCGHPGESSFCSVLADAYAEGASGSGHDVRRQNIAEMTFDPNLEGGHYHTAQPLEPDLETFWDNLQWCDHFVLVHPMWWGSHPAKLKGVFDRVFLPHAAFEPSKGVGFAKPLLAGRSTRVLMTCDTPSWFLRLAYGGPVLKQTNRQIFQFCGMKSNRFNVLSPIKASSDRKRQNWLERSKSLGTRAA